MCHSTHMHTHRNLIISIHEVRSGMHDLVQLGVHELLTPQLDTQRWSLSAIWL